MFLPDDLTQPQRVDKVLKNCSEMDFKPKKKLEEDRLWLTFAMVTVVFKFKIIRRTMVAILALHISTIFVELCFLFDQPHYLRKYAPWLLLKPLGLCTTTVLLYERKSIVGIWDGYYVWAYDSAGEKVQRKIERGIRGHYMFVFVTIAIGAVFIISAGLPNPHDCDFYFNLFLFGKLYPEYSTVFNVTMKGLYGPLLYTSLSYPFFINYAVQHCLYQTQMWMEHVRNLTFDYNDMDDGFLINDQQYQKVVHDRLKFIAKRHQDFLEFSNQWSGHLQTYFVPLALSTFCLGLSIAMTFYGLCTGIYEMTVLNALTVVPFTIVAAIVFSSVMGAAQAVETETGKFANELYSLRWSTWTKQNLSTFLNIYTVAGQAIKLRYSESIYLGHELGFKMVKGMYSVVSVFFSTQRRHA